jgi:hypothetical protein
MEFFGGDRWVEDEDETRNDTPPADVDKEFVEKALNTKHTIYEETILKPDIEDDSAQDTSRIDDYLNNINNVYVLAIVSQNGKKNSHNLEQFPKGAQEVIQQTLEWLETFFSKNQTPDTIPYVNFIRNHFHVFPFVQK